MEKEYYTIGEVSKICGIPIRTLHYYDAVDLLKPEKKDEETNYRYYTSHQLLLINIISQFKIEGYSLKEIKEKLGTHSISFSAETIIKKREEVHQTIQRLIQLEERLNKELEIIQYVNAPMDVHLKFLTKRTILFIRKRAGGTPQDFMLRFAELNHLLKKKSLLPSGPIKAIYYDDYRQYDFRNADIEVAVEIQHEDSQDANIREFGGEWVVSALHHGAYEKEPQTYKEMLDWMKLNGYEINGAAIENYLVDHSLTSNIDEFVTELMIPVKKI
ncbi:MAG: MerR family transcriptional regulator [Beduini sp.]|uniref:MerR family transcriptional regulator n=1 Tax=Beduini sp. TaxID=1922300 RepID=UPI0039A0666C